MRTIGERIDSKEELYRRMGESWAANLRVAIPGIIQAFDPVTQTVTVQPAIRERVTKDGTLTPIELPQLIDVPIIIPRAGGYSLTLPVSPGDECLVIFADMCIDAWWSNGGIQNEIEKRRHDLSDGFAILGCWSQPRKISNYSTNSARLQNSSGTAYIEVKNSEINLVGTVKINGQLIGGG